MVVVSPSGHGAYCRRGTGTRLPDTCCDRNDGIVQIDFNRMHRGSPYRFPFSRMVGRSRSVLFRLACSMDWDPRRIESAVRRMMERQRFSVSGELRALVITAFGNTSIGAGLTPISQSTNGTKPAGIDAASSPARLTWPWPSAAGVDGPEAGRRICAPTRLAPRAARRVRLSLSHELPDEFAEADAALGHEFAGFLGFLWCEGRNSSHTAAGDKTSPPSGGALVRRECVEVFLERGITPPLPAWPAQPLAGRYRPLAADLSRGLRPSISRRVIRALRDSISDICVLCC